MHKASPSLLVKACLQQPYTKSRGCPANFYVISTRGVILLEKYTNSRRTKKILAVDDDVCILELYKEIFSKAGFEIQTAEDAAGALIRFQDFKPALLILDVDMPAGGGKKVFERLRIQLASPAPIIFSTAFPETVTSLEKNLNVIVLKKPLIPWILVEAVRKLLKLV